MNRPCVIQGNGSNSESRFAKFQAIQFKLADMATQIDAWLDC